MSEYKNPDLYKQKEVKQLITPQKKDFKPIEGN